jgi:hypothetical protein
MISRWIRAGAAMVLVLSLAACGGMNNTGDGGTNGGVTTKGTRGGKVINQNGNNNANSRHNNTRMELDEKIANAITDLPEVESATVLLTDKNAYVAVMLDNGNGNGRGMNNMGMTNRNNRGTGTNGTGITGNMGGTGTNGTGITGNMGGTGTNGTGITGNLGGTGMNGTGITGNTGGAGAGGAGVMNGNGVSRGGMNTVGTGDNRLRSGFAGSDDGDHLSDDLTPELKNKIADTVKKQSQNVRNVYVSANPDFVGTMRGYGQEFNNGHPIRGAIIEFNRMVERVFPDNAER